MALASPIKHDSSSPSFTPIAVSSTSTVRQVEEYAEITVQEGALMSMAALADIWDTPEEDEAWKDL